MMKQLSPRGRTSRTDPRLVLLFGVLAFGSACAGSDEPDGDPDFDDDSGYGTGARLGSGAGNGMGASSGGGVPGQMGAGGADRAAGTGGESSGGDGSEGTGASASMGTGGELGSGGDGAMVEPGAPALGSHDGDGTGCAAGQIVDSCGLCDGDGSSCGCPEGELCWDLVFWHNEVRRELNLGEFADQPIPDPPIAMVGWDPLIADKAQEHADSMDDWADGHSTQQFRTYQSTHLNGYHGENMAIGGGGFSEPEAFVYDGWSWDEAQGCTLKDCGGHYTQVAWRDSVWIGCGRKADVPFVVEGQTYEGTLTVCQYGPGGNGPGPMY